MGRLDGKVVVITGAARGMGVEHARRCVDEGAEVVVADVLEDEGYRAAHALGPQALFVRHDVTDPESWSDLVRRTSDAFGPITVLVNNAGLAGPVATVADMTTEDYLRTIAVDQHGIFFGMRAVIGGMIEAGVGSIVNISSVAGMVHQTDVPNPAYRRRSTRSPRMYRCGAWPSRPRSRKWSCSSPRTNRPTSPARNCSSTEDRPPIEEAPRQRSGALHARRARRVRRGRRIRPVVSTVRVVRAGRA